MSKVIKKIPNSFFESLSVEQMKSVNLFLNTHLRKEQLLKENKTIDIEVNVITTYENEPQQMFDLMINDFKPDLVCSVSNEILILSRIIMSLKEMNDRDLDYLVKISIGYVTFFVDGEKQKFEDSQSQDMFLDSINLEDTISRSNSKYYFQPNQRDIVSRIVADTLEISKLTPLFDEQDFIDHMVETPRYKEGESLILENKSIFLEGVSV